MQHKLDDLGNRIKAYENVNRLYLTRRMPLIIRIDGIAFHNFTKGLERPFDNVFVKTMQDTMKELCSNIEGCVLGYTQSDEISLVICDYDKLDTQPWFDKNLQKICSVSASMATLYFNVNFAKNVEAFLGNYKESKNSNGDYIFDVYQKKINTAMFDSRAFVIPKEEVNNCLVWRQQDAIRNSIQMLAQANFRHIELQGKSCEELKTMLIDYKHLDWNKQLTHLKRGSCCIKEIYELNSDERERENIKSTDRTVTKRSRWIIDKEIPIFSKDTDYVNNLI